MTENLLIDFLTENKFKPLFTSLYTGNHNGDIVYTIRFEDSSVLEYLNNSFNVIFSSHELGIALVRV